MLIAILLVALTLVLAFANGANDVSKGIATLAGSGVTSYKRAVLWGSLCTVAGALAAAFASQTLVETFSGKGIVARAASGPAFFAAVAIGAIGWLVIATLTGLPVSTTHSLAGALAGAAIVSAGWSGILWSAIGERIALPLVASPAMSLVLLVVVAPGGISLRESWVNPLHWMSAGATSFFRGLNDTPKILAVGIAAAALLRLSSLSAYALVAFAMGAGSVIAGFRVTRTLAAKVTPITPSNGLAANVATSLLVGLASKYALPVSTTHVSSGAIIGIGLSKRRVQWRTVWEIVLAWIVTLPVSALIAAAASVLFQSAKMGSGL